MRWLRSLSAPARSHRARPRLEMLEDRTVPATFATEFGGVLFISGDATVNKVEIKDNGTNAAGNIRFRLDSNFSFEDDVNPWRVTSSAIKTIIVNTGSNNDIVRYRLTNDLAAGVFHDVQVSLGAGHDIYWGEVRGLMRNDSALRMIANGGSENDQLAAFGFNDLQARANLGISFDGGSGHDNIWGLMDNDVDIADDAVLWMNMWGQDGNDYFGVRYAGDLHGELYMHLEGGNNDDTVDAVFSLSAVSTGRVGDPDAPNTFQGNWNRYALVSGDAGNDRLNFHIYNPNPSDDATISARVLGGEGIDHYRRTGNVERPEALAPGESDGP